jgi:uncharacterized protein YdeI (YjbR/CyaY-like superfamily)
MAEERILDVPAYLTKALTAAERRTFDAMPYSHRKEYVDWIVSAKKPETRERRVQQARERLQERAQQATAAKPARP